MFTLKVVMQVISSSAPAQSMCPSQVLSNRMNFTDRVQKKYLLSIKFLMKYAAMASMPSINITVSVVINTFLIFALFSIGVFGAVMGLLWRPGRGTGFVGFNGLEVSSGS